MSKDFDDEKRNILKDGILISPDQDSWTPEAPQGSFYKAVVSLTRSHLEEFGDWVLLHDHIRDEKFFASKFEPLSKRFSVVYSKFGLKRGDSIHLVIGNHNLTLSACGGAWILGAAVSCGDVALDSKAIAGQLADTEAKIVLVTPDTAQVVLEAVNRQNNNKTVHVLAFGNVNGLENVYRLLDEATEDEAPDPLDALDLKNDVTIIFWSSGTTGLPKGICHSHYSAFNWTGALLDMASLHSNILTTTCFFHVGGFFAGINALRKCQTYHHMFGPGFSLQLLLDTIKEVKPIVMSLGTHHYVQLAESEILRDSNPEDLDSVEVVGPAGAAVPSSCEILFKKKFPKLKAVVNCYGQTESGLALVGTSPFKLGLVAPAVAIKIENPDTRQKCAPREVGEISIKNDYLMKGYLKRPKETEEFFDSEGFGHSGDLGYYDENGDVYFVDRMKELIKYKNNHIAPTELEEILQSHPAVQECLVFGKKDDHVQEIVTAVVIRKNGFKVTEEELVDHVNDRIGIDFKKIRGGIIFREKIPRNNVGKLLRREMREWAARQVNGN